MNNRQPPFAGHGFSQNPQQNPQQDASREDRNMGRNAGELRLTGVGFNGGAPQLQGLGAVKGQHPSRSTQPQFTPQHPQQTAPQVAASRAPRTRAEYLAQTGQAHHVQAHRGHQADQQAPFPAHDQASPHCAPPSAPRGAPRAAAPHIPRASHPLGQPQSSQAQTSQPQTSLGAPGLAVVAGTAHAAPKLTQVPAPHSGTQIRAAKPGNGQSHVTSADPAINQRFIARAELAAVYAGYLGVKALPADMLDVFQAHEGAQKGHITPEMMSRALQSIGLEAEVSAVAHVLPDEWPAIAAMVNGQAVLVLDQQGHMLTIYDTSQKDLRAEVPLEDFEPFFTGLLVQARASSAQLTKRHLPKPHKTHWFWGEFLRYRRQIGEVAMGSMVANMLAVGVALFSLQVYDRVIPHQSQSTLWVLAIGAVLAVTMEGVLKLARARLMDGAGRSIELAVQRNLMDKILGMKSDQRPQSASGLFSAMREFGSVREFFTASTIGTMTDIPFLFVFLALVGSIAGNLVFVLIAGGILMVLPGFLLQGRMMRLTEEAQGASTRSSRLLQETIYELDTLKTQRGEDRIRRLWDELNTLSTLKSSQQRKLASLLTYWSQGVQQLTYIAAVVIGAYMVFAGEFTVGSIIAVGILTSRTLAPLTQVAATLARWSNVKTALRGLDAIIDAQQDTAEDRSYLRREVLSGHFELRDLQYRYDKDSAPVLDVAGMAILPGQSLAVLGANGSGKSTLLKILAGLYAPTSGRVMVDGVDMAQLAPRDLRRNIGYLGQDVRLFAGTLRDNLNLTQLERDDDRLLAALDFAGIGPFVRSHPKGLDLEIKDAGEGLSIGQRQSLGWARLWLQDPGIVLLDEPTAALDQQLERTLVDRLKPWLAGRTAVIATHRAPILTLTNRTAILQNGRLTVDGPRDAVLAHLFEGQANKGGK